MKSRHRIRTIYCKELVDIMRDRRTLIAMIVVPIVLYPLLMLGSVQAVSFQGDRLSKEAFVIGVISDHDRLRLANMINSNNEVLTRAVAVAGPEFEDLNDYLQTLVDAQTVVYETRAELENALRDRRVQVGVIFERDELVREARYDQQVTVELLADLEEVRSLYAKMRIEDVLTRVGERMVEARLAREHLPAAFIDPFPIDVVDLSSPPSILGQVLPLILILMTITGAIYPAIDLTAGERERGTLESLMACPVPVIDLVVGKFLVVTTIAIMGAALNLGSVTATVYFGGFDKIIATTGGGIPWGKMAFILAALIPFAVLMSAIMMAVCSYARTFKEAQNYVTPVILAVLIPGGIAALPATRLEGVMLVMPVGNMVLLSRDVLLGASIPPWNVAMVLLSTSLYAAAAIAIAAGIFGRESVVFSDAGSLRSIFARTYFSRRRNPPISTGLLFVALLFPTWFFVQSALSPEADEDARGLLTATGWLMPTLFVALPIAVMLYWKIGVATALSLRMPSPRYLFAGLLIGVSAWVPAFEVNVLLRSLIGTPEAVSNSSAMLAETIAEMSPAIAFLLIAVIPAICEEFLFRGFLLGSLGTVSKKWGAIFASAAIFAVFHFFLFKFAVTAMMGVVLGYLCWESRSIVPAILAHGLHNAIGVLTVVAPDKMEWLIGAADSGADIQGSHLPVSVLVVGGAVFVCGLICASQRGLRTSQAPIPAAVGG